jgi:hypothetical protein
VADEPALVEHDSRGILAPWLLRQRVTLTRYPATPALAGLVDRFWCVRWDLPDGAVHRQEVLTHPGANLVVSHPDADAPLAPRRGSRYAGLEAVVSGVATAVVTRTLAGSGWAVAAMTTPGGLGAFTRGPAPRLTDTVVPLEQVLDVDADALIARMAGDADEPARVGAFATTLEKAVHPRRVPGARWVAAAARIAETDRSVRSLADLAARTATPARTLQRRFDTPRGGVPELGAAALPPPGRRRLRARRRTPALGRCGRGSGLQRPGAPGARLPRGHRTDPRRIRQLGIRCEKLIDAGGTRRDRRGKPVIRMCDTLSIEYAWWRGCRLACTD